MKNIIEIILIIIFALSVIFTFRSYFRYNNPKIDEDCKPTASGVKFLATLDAVLAVIIAVVLIMFK